MTAPIRRRPPAGRTFYLTAFALTILAILSFLKNQRGDAKTSSRLLGRSLAARDLECRLVHQFPDKCAFVQANCPDEEAGLISYLRFYYCSVPRAQPVAFMILVIWISLLFSTIGIAASDFLCINLGTIASILGMSESLAGVTFLAFGNGSPDVFSTFAAMSSHSGSLAVGELIGAASFITAVVAGSMALVRPFKVAKKSFIRDVGFFVVAASFSMVFLADGRLQTWECACMVGFYVFYVIFVVTWHWWLARRRRRRQREAAAKSHQHIPRAQELDTGEEAEDEDAPANESTALLRSTPEDDFASLEGNIPPAWKDEDEDDEDGDGDGDRERQMAQLRSSMRVMRPARGERRDTLTPIRPSLVGALEFRSVMSSLGRRSMHSPPGDLPRYSDDASIAMGQVDGPSSHPVPARSISHQPRGHSGLLAPSNAGGRGRAVSENDAIGFTLPSQGFRGGDAAASEPALQIDSPLLEAESRISTPSGLSPALGSPTLFISPPESSQPSRDPSPAPPSRSPNHLALPGASSHHPDHDEQHQGKSPSSRLSSNTSNTPATAGPRSPTPKSPSSDFAAYEDSPTLVVSSGLGLPSIGIPTHDLSRDTGRRLSHPAKIYEEEEEDKDELRTFAWWPYKYLPPPQIIGRTLFPTIYSWGGKSIWDKLLGIVTVPSVLLLTITLPVVEAGAKEEPPEAVSGLLIPGEDAQSRTGIQVQSPLTSPELAARQQCPRTPTHPPLEVSLQTNIQPTPTKADGSPAPPQGWNRWLVCLQIFTAPLFTVLIIWANLDEEHDFKSLLYLLLCSLLLSLVCLVALLALTTPDHPPRYRSLFCFLGFAVAIAWISTIAGEVVGVLKAIGVILGISDAILGLTIFAIGNSLGDLVADITVARLGFPVMALSACFGGPMLNILLGIGVSGLYITLKHGAKAHTEHPERPVTYKPYQIEVSTTLLISGVTLLVTLAGLLVGVPLNGWKMDRKIGWGLICLWSLSTVGNVVVEILGWGGDLTVL